MSPSAVPGLMATAGHRMESVFLDEDKGRQLLHVTFGSVLTLGRTESGRPFKEALLEILDAQEALHCEVLEKHLGRHLQALRAG